MALGLGAPALSATQPQLEAARTHAIAWLETNQQADGSWSPGPNAPVVTAEALLALVKADYGESVAAQRAIVWLRNREFTGLDHRARKIRALAAAGFDMRAEAQALQAEANASGGWGPVPGAPDTSYDTALAAAGVRAGDPLADLSLAQQVVFDRDRGDKGWSADFLPLAEGASDPTMTGEIVRALGPVVPTIGTLNQPAFFLRDLPVTAQTPTLELAARFAGLNETAKSSAAVEDELVVARLGAWGDDALVYALGLLAVTTKPTIPLPPLDPQGNEDGDAALNGADAFPFDPNETADFDGDGIGDVADPDDDGDGVPEPADLFPNDPNEWADADGDGAGDNVDLDDDDDNVPDDLEARNGTDPLRADTDGDGVDDDVDACPLVAGSVDGDADGVCQPDDCDDADPLEYANLDGDAF